MKKIVSLLFVINLVIAAPIFGADMQNEIDHLLLFVAETTCQYERNGTVHTGREAVAHIKQKYDHFKKEIDSAEKFIELSATKSTMSGKYYQVQCDSHPKVTSQEWLLQELKKYRAR
ncbi:MAG: hypothetical protein FD130_156 [Halothiobacillaceae bacterium]|nr:MAG: hypothetical protein FD130_156 [Halothiobacillaceae bacterium]